MKRIRLMVLMLAATSVLSGAASSSSQGALCFKVAEAGTGKYINPICTAEGAPKEYIRIKRLTARETGGIWCAEVTETMPFNGNRNNSKCENLMANGPFIRVQVHGPFWHANGVKLNQGSKGIKLQSKGPLVLKSEIIAKPENVKFLITCNSSTGEGTIDGQGETKQGQAKGSVTYEKCKIETTPEVKGCAVNEPIKTGQLKSHLAYGTVQGEEQVVELFEPAPTQQTTEKIFTTIKIKTCGVLEGPHNIKGSVVAELSPQESEGVEGSLYFPEPPITTIIHEGEEVKGIGLFFGTEPATFSGFYGASLQNLANFGVFSN